MEWKPSCLFYSSQSFNSIQPSWLNLSCFPQFSGAFSPSSAYQWPPFIWCLSASWAKVLCFSSWTSPPPAECALPDCIGEVAPSSSCSLEAPNCPGCTEEEQVSSRHPPRQPPLRTQGLYQDTPSCFGTLRKMEERSPLWKRHEVYIDLIVCFVRTSVGQMFKYMTRLCLICWWVVFTFEQRGPGLAAHALLSGTVCFSNCGRWSRRLQWALPGSPTV